MTEAPDWALAVPAVGVHNAPPRVPGPDLLQITWQQMQQVISGLVNEFLRQVAVALGAIEIFGFKPYQALVEIGEKIEAGVDNFNLLLTAFGLPTIGDVADLLANQANDFANFLAATGQATFAALGAALNALIAWLTAIPANLLSGALPTNVTLSGTQLGTLLQYLNSSGQYAAAQLTGALNTGLTFSGTALSTLLQYLNGSGQFAAAQLTGGINTAVTFGGTQLGTLLQYLSSSGQFNAAQLTGGLNSAVTFGGTALSTFFGNINSSGGLLASGLTGAFNGAVTLGGNSFTTLLQYLNSSGQFAAGQLTGAINGAVTLGGTTLSTLATNINSSGQLLASGLTGGLNAAVTFGGTALSTFFQNISASGQLLAPGITGALNGGLTLGGVTLSTLVTNINSSGQILAAGITGALGTGLTVGGVTLSTLFTNINSSGQILGAGITGAINTAATIGGTALSTLSTNWNAAVTNVNSLISGVSGASTAADVATNINLAATNIAQIGTAAQNAAAGVVGSLNTAATQVQTAFSGIFNGLFGAFTGTPAPANQTQAQVTAAAQNVTTNFVGNAATFVGIQNAQATAANLMAVAFKFADYGTGTVALPSSFTLSNDNSYYPGSGGSIELVDGRAVYKQSGTSASEKVARYNVVPTTTDYQEVSWVHTGNQDGGPATTSIYTRMNASATSFLKFEIQNGNQLNMISVVAGTDTYEGSANFKLKPGAKYTIKVGSLANNRDIYLYENDVLKQISGSAATHQIGASYRYAGFGFSGINTGTQWNNFGIDVFSIADQVFKPGPGATALVSTSQTTTSTSYADLATTTDSVTVTIGSSGMAQVDLFANLANSTNYAFVGFAISGATTQAASDTQALKWANASGNEIQVGAPFVVSGLNPGSTTFKMKYRVVAGTGTFQNRRIGVIPL